MQADTQAEATPLADAPGSRGERGAAAVEFAMVAVPLLTLLVGIIQMSILLWAYQAGAHAAGEGVRLSAVNPCGDYVARAKAVLGAASSDPRRTSVSRTYAPALPQVGGIVTVTVAYPVANIVGPLIPGVPSRITKTASARIEDLTC